MIVVKDLCNEGNRRGQKYLKFQIVILIYVSLKKGATRNVA